MHKLFTKVLVLLLAVVPAISYSQITVSGPVVLYNSLDTICVGSVMDIPFTSTGSFANNNTYIAQLSDSTGSFTNAINVLGSLASSQEFADGGTISGSILSTNQPVPAGCNYYIRVVSTHPVMTGGTYGPFCIRHCDIETNNLQDMHVCISELTGVDTSLHVGINTYDPSVVYSPTDTFQVQILSSYTFNVLNTGALGYLVAGTTDTVMHISIPGTDSLYSFRMASGEYYLRVIATNSSEPWNASGTVVRLIIGAPADTLSVEILDNAFAGHSVPDTTICNGDSLFYGAFPYNYYSQSSYRWTLDGDTTWPDNFGTTGINFLAPGINYLSVLENNNGCLGRPSDTAVINVVPLPVPDFTVSADTTQPHHYIAVNNSSGQGPLSYYWSWGDNTYDSVAYPSHIYANAGYYNICLAVTDGNGCSNTFCDNSFDAQRTTNTMVYINVVAPTGINELSKQTPDVTVYPNPAADELYINTSGLLGNNTVSIFNMLGELIYTKEINSKQETVNCKPFSSGIYFLQIKSENGSVVKRFVKE